jgi:hypothetical protein
VIERFLFSEPTGKETEMMQMELDKSEDELDLERLVFGDTEGIKERIKGEKSKEKTVQETNLEHLEDDQVRNTFLKETHANSSYSLSTQENRLRLQPRQRIQRI